MKKHWMVLIGFLSIMVAVQYYIIGRLFVWAGIPLDATFIGLVSALVIAHPIATLLESRFLHWSTRSLYTITAIWVGSLSILLMAVLVGEVLRLWLESHVVVWVVLALTATLVGVSLVHGRRFCVVEHTITGNIKKPVRLAVATDVHAGAVHGKRYLGLVVEAIQNRGAHFVLLPGDLVDGPGKLPDDLLAPLDDLTVPTYYSFGNHEQYVGEDEVRRVLKNRHVKALRSTYVDHDGVRIIGIDDAEDRKQVAKQLPGLTKKGAFNILLYHRPDGLEDAASQGVDLMLSGHTHFGQIFPFTLLVKLRFPRVKGWYAYKNTKLFVSTGAGTWGPPMRLGSRSELVFITILPE